MRPGTWAVTIGGYLVGLAAGIFALTWTLSTGPEQAPAELRNGVSEQAASEESADAARERYLRAEIELRESALMSDLQTMRSQIELYKVQHLDQCPGMSADGKFDGQLFVGQLTGFTDRDGRMMRADAAGADFPYGPYLQRMPGNPFVPHDVRTVIRGGPCDAPGDASSGWWFNTTTGAFSPNDSEHRGM